MTEYESAAVWNIFSYFTEWKKQVWSSNGPTFATVKLSGKGKAIK